MRETYTVIKNGALRSCFDPKDGSPEWGEIR